MISEQLNQTMKTKFVFPLWMLFVLLISACTKLSETVSSSSSGINGGFEIFESGLPVNWSVYTPEIVKDGEFKILPDQEVFCEGKQSLMFDVKSCSDQGGHYSPGFFGEYHQFGFGQYEISGYILNQNTHYRIAAGPVSTHHGSVITLIDKRDTDLNWMPFSFLVDVPEGSHLRFEMSVLSAGVCRIDQLKIEKR